MMKVQVQSFRIPGWAAPAALLLGLALIPVALFIALSLLALALGVGAVRLLLPSAPRRRDIPGRSKPSSFSSASSGPVLDVEYEVKDPHEKDQRDQG